MKFSNAELAAKYDILVENNPLIVVGNFRGRLTEMPTEKHIESMIARNSKLVALKSTTVKAPSYNNMNKAELQAAATEKNIAFDESTTNAELKRLLTESDNTTT